MSEEFQVSQSQQVVEEFRRVLDTARDRDLLAVTLRASRWILEELARTPMEFGESREYLTHLDLHLRIGFAGAVYVEFAVNLTNRVVFIRRFGIRYRRDEFEVTPRFARVLSVGLRWAVSGTDSRVGRRSAG